VNAAAPSLTRAEVVHSQAQSQQAQPVVFGADGTVPLNEEDTASSHTSAPPPSPTPSLSLLPDAAREQDVADPAASALASAVPSAAATADGLLAPSALHEDVAPAAIDVGMAAPVRDVAQPPTAVAALVDAAGVA
jgi:hypothetical protein